tara:strand:- start:1997 stop:3178 length:1182 start_codon:yes stop_codon:yes gene_type:complete
MSITNNNNLELYKAISIISIGIIITFSILLFYVPIFSTNYFYDVGTVLIFSGNTNDIPNGWAICDGENGTPDLTNKFIIGAWSSKYPHIEKTNNGRKVQYVGNGFDPQLIKDSNKIIDQGALGFMTGQIPFTLGHTYSDSTYHINSQINSKNISSVGSDHGTNWFKQYIYNNRGSECRMDNKSNSITENFSGKYYRDQEHLTDLCTGMTQIVDSDGHHKFKDSNYILNDHTLTAYNKMITITNGKPHKPDFKFYYDVNNPFNELYPNEYKQENIFNRETQTTSLEDPIEPTGISHVPVKRRLFRDYEDYKILLEEGKRLGVSCYDCLPMNHKFTNHTYEDNIYIDTKSIYNNNNIISFQGRYTFKEYINNVTYEKPYSNNPSFFKLAYIIRIK